MQEPYSQKGRHPMQQNKKFLRVLCSLLAAALAAADWLWARAV